MKSRTTVNGLKISYSEETDEVAFEKSVVSLDLKMGEDELDLLYEMTLYHKYKKFLLIQQNSSVEIVVEAFKLIPVDYSKKTRGNFVIFSGED